jgi:NitT/TauT family transport system permease protein
MIAGRRLVLGAAGVAGTILLAEAASRLGLVDEQSLPAASTVLSQAGQLAVDSAFLVDVGDTLRAWAVGLLLAIAIAVPLGVLLGSVPLLDTASRVLVEMARPIPSVALIPLVLILFTEVTSQKVALVCYAATWPILINTLYALRDVDPVAKDSLRAFGFGESAVLWRVSLPSAAPFIATGVRISASVGLIVVISTELIAGGGEGIGLFLTESQAGGGDTTVMLAGACWAGALGLAANSGLVGLERVLFRWHTARAEGVA